MSKTKFVFHRDQFGVCVFYAGMNRKHRHTSGLKINTDLDFDPTEDCVVPTVVRLSSSETESKITGYVSNVDQTKTMTVTTYEAERTRLEAEIKVKYDSMAEEVAANVAWRRFEEEWDAEEKDVEIHTEHEFEVIDIDYPADERLIPLRHFDTEKVNYFEVHGKKVAIKMMHKLCRDAGLTEAGRYDREKVRRYKIDDTYSISWSIEGQSLEDCVRNINLDSFTGHLRECREYINDVEAAVREGFDRWMISGRTARGLTVKYVTDALNTLERTVRYIDPKKRTESEHKQALLYIEQLKSEIQAMGLQDLMTEEENLSDALDNATL